MDGDEADGPGLVRGAEVLYDAGLAHQPGTMDHFGEHEVARLRALPFVATQDVSVLVAAVRRRQSQAAGVLLEDTQNTVRCGADAANDPGRVGTILRFPNAGEDPLARPERRPAAPFHRDIDRRRRVGLLPRKRARQHLAVRIRTGDLENGDRRQAVQHDEEAARASRDLPFLQHFLQRRLEPKTGIAGQAKDASNLALANGRGALSDEIQDFVFAWEIFRRVFLRGHGL